MRKTVIVYTEICTVVGAGSVLYRWACCMRWLLAVEKTRCSSDLYRCLWCAVVCSAWWLVQTPSRHNHSVWILQHRLLRLESMHYARSTHPLHAARTRPRTRYSTGMQASWMNCQLPIGTRVLRSRVISSARRVLLTRHLVQPRRRAR